MRVVVPLFGPSSVFALGMDGCYCASSVALQVSVFFVGFGAM